MSYTSENLLPRGTRLSRIRKILDILGYCRIPMRKIDLPNLVGQYRWFAEDAYRSNTGVGLGIYDRNGSLSVETHTAAARSHWDLEQQNRTIWLLRAVCGGEFQTDAGKNRCYRNIGPAPTPAESGCAQAYEQFGANLIRGEVCLGAASFPEHWTESPTGLWFADVFNPRLLFHHLLLVYLVATVEDYFRSTYVALLRYSECRGEILKGVQLSAQAAGNVSTGHICLEEAVAQSMGFAQPRMFLRHFERLDTKLKLDKALKSPVGRRKRRLDEDLDAWVALRNEFVHHSGFDVTLTRSRMEHIHDDLELAINRCAARVFVHYGWELDKTWGRPSTRQRKKLAAQ